MSALQPTLSLCMIVRNEAHFLRRCLGAVREHVDEMVIVDTGSTDDTRAIAADFTDRIFDFEWIDDFAAARNHALEQASGDWILVLDADELLSAQDAGALRPIVGSAQADAFYLREYNYSDNALEAGWIPVAGDNPYAMGYKGYRESKIARLFRHRDDIRYRGRVHEVIDHTPGQLKLAELPLVLHHHGDADPSKPLRDRQLNYLRLMEQVLATEPTGRLYKSAASAAMYHQQDVRKAMRYFQAAADLDYDVQECLEGVAEGHYRCGEFAEAYALYTQLYSEGFRSFTLLSNLANLMVKSDQYGHAVQLLTQSLSQGVSDQNTINRIRHNISVLEEKLANSPSAR